MSVVRFGEEGSDVYIYVDFTSNDWVCSGCTLENHRVPLQRGVAPMNAHLELHRSLGDCVPTWVDESALLEEQF